MAFVDDHMTIIGDTVLYDALSHKALDGGYIDSSRRPRATAANAAYVFLGNSKELKQPFDPLIEQLPPMYEDQCIDTPPSDHASGNHRLAERSCCRKDSDVVFEQFSNGRLLFRSQFPLER